MDFLDLKVDQETISEIVGKWASEQLIMQGAPLWLGSLHTSKSGLRRVTLLENLHRSVQAFLLLMAG